MLKQANQRQDRDFGLEVARIMPLILRELARRQKDSFSKIALTVPQIVLVDSLVAQGSCKMKELANALNLTMSAATAIVDKMIKARLVRRERSSEDRRVVNVILLQKGKDIAKEIVRMRRGALNEIFFSLSREEKDEYIRILKKAYEGLKKRQ